MIIFLVIVALLITLLAFVRTLPNTFRVQRTINIDAPAEKVFALLDDFHRWEAWSPWENIDPLMKRTFSGSSRGKGAVYAWEGKKNVGTGRMEILSTTAPNQLCIQLDFIKPFKAHNMAEFSVQTFERATLVTWVMYGSRPYMIKLMGLFMDMDKMIGKDFDKGLNNLKLLAEAPEKV